MELRACGSGSCLTFPGDVGHRVSEVGIEPLSVSYGRILLLEDDQGLRDLLAEMLEDHGYEVVAVGSGEQAVTQALDQTLDLIVADIRMAGMSGLDALARVKENQPDIGTLVMTGYASEEDSIRALQLGVGNYLKKPFRLPDFLSAVQALIARRRQAQRAQLREQALRRTTLWALESVGRSLDLGLGRERGLVETARLSARAARALGAGPELAEDIQLTCLSAGLEQRSACPEHLAQAVPDAVGELWKQLSTESASPGLPLRILRPLLAELNDTEAAPDAEIEAVLARCRSELEQPPAEEEAARRRHLLSLGRALSDRGDTQSATSAFRQVLEGAPRLSREGVEARLSLAQLARAEQRTEASLELALEAARQAAELGPVWGAGAALEAALLLVQQAHPEGISRLREVAAALPVDSPLSARARLAAAHYAGEGTGETVQKALTILMRPEHLDQLAGSANWLLPALLEHQGRNPQALLARALTLLVRELPNTVERILAQGLSDPARKAAAQALAESGSLRALARLHEDPNPEIRDLVQRTLASKGEQSAPIPVLRLYSLGSFEAHLGDTRIEDWRSQKVRYLLALLAAQGGRPVSLDHLEEVFWPEDPTRSRQNLNAACSGLRKALQGENYVLRTPGGLTLNPDLPRWHDLDELERALRQDAQSQKPCLEALIEAARLYRGPYLDGCYMDWALTRRAHLETLMLAALQRLASALLAQERHLEAVEFARMALEIDSCCQEAHQSVMRALLGLGHPEQAVRQYEQCRQVLHKELQMEPSIALMELHQRALLSLD